MDYKELVDTFSLVRPRTYSEAWFDWLVDCQATAKSWGLDADLFLNDCQGLPR